MSNKIQQWRAVRRMSRRLSWARIQAQSVIVAEAIEARHYAPASWHGVLNFNHKKGGKIMQISQYFVSKFRAGESGYYDGRKRGTVAVFWDSKLYLYKQPTKADRKAFKRAIAAEFGKLSGRWPSYSA